MYQNLVALGVLRPKDKKGFERCQRWYPHAIGLAAGLKVRPGLC